LLKRENIISESELSIVLAFLGFLGPPWIRTDERIRDSNLGEGALKSSTMLKKINAGRHEEVPTQIKRWNKAGGKVVKGLERRHEAEAELYRMRWY